MRGLRLGDVANHVRAARLGPLLLAVALATLTFPLRALRWRLLLRLPDGDPLPRGPAWHAIAIGYMANNLLPLRAGEVLRGYAVSRLTSVRLSTAIASIAVERAFDALTVVGMLGAALLTAAIPSEVEIRGRPVAELARWVGLAAGAGLVAAAGLLARPDLATRLIERLVPWPGVARRLVVLLHGVREGLSALKSPARLAGLLLWCLLVWGVNALSFLALFPAFGLEVGLGGAVLVQGAIVFGIAAPSMPGFIGVFEAMIVVSLALYGVPQEQAFAYAVTYHATTFLPITLLGLVSLGRTPLGWRDLGRGRRTAADPATPGA